MNPVTARERRKEGECQKKCRMLSGVSEATKAFEATKECRM